MSSASQDAPLHIPPPVSQAEFARLRGVSRQAVNKMITSGRLRPPAVLSDGRIDIGQAARLLGGAVPAAPATHWVPDARPPSSADEARAWGDERDAANLALKALQRRRAELELDELEGRLVDRAAAEAAYEERARRLRDALLDIPALVADDCVRLTDSRLIEERIQSAIEAALASSAEREHADAV